MTGSWPAATPVPGRMSAVVFREFGGPQVLELTELDTPVPGEDEVLVRVAAVCVGRLLDLAARAGTHPYATFELPHVLGAEHAGVIAAVGAGVTGLAVGDRTATFPAISDGTCMMCRRGYAELCRSLQVIGTHRQGAYAEYVAVPARNVTVVPDDISPVDAATVAQCGAVAFNQLNRAGFTPGDWVLVQGASSALGSLTANLARHLGGRVIGTSRSVEKRERLAAELKIDAILDATAPDFVATVRELTGGAGVDIAIDSLGSSRIWASTMDCLAVGGAVVTSGAFLGGRVTVDLRRLYSAGQRIIGVRTGNPASVAQLWAAVGEGFRGMVDRTFPLEAAVQAHEFLESDREVGRVAITVPW